MSTFEARRGLLGPVLFEAGGGLMDCQGFELGVALLLLHFSRPYSRARSREGVSRPRGQREKTAVSSSRR